MINGSLIKASARRIQAAMNLNLSEYKRIELRFSNGLLQNFQKRNNLRLMCHGESGDADVVSIERELSHIKNVIAQFTLEDVFNADEFGYCYRQTPERTIATERMQGRKKEKTRLTLACCNGDGSEKIPLMCIGKAQKPRCFKRKSGAEHGFDYHSNSKAWISDWLLRFSCYITRSNPARNVLLLLDNCSAHGSNDSLPPMENVKVLFLPPNTTSKLQPLEAGIIASLKGYRSVQYDRVFDLIDAGEANIYKVDQLTAMRNVRDIWGSFPSKLIHNCWKHTLLGEPTGELDDGAICRDVEEAVSRLVPERCMGRISISALINPEEENDVFENPTEEELGVQAAVAMTAPV